MTDSTQKTTTQSQTGPYAASVPQVTQLLNNLQGQTPPLLKPSPDQLAAVKNIGTLAGMTPNLAGPAGNTAWSLLSPGGTDPNKLLQGAYNDVKGAQGDLSKELAPYLSSSYLDPMSTPGIQNVLKTIQQDVGNSVNGEFAAAGRDLSPANSMALARGISQGEAVPLLNQYNQNVAAQQGAANAIRTGAGGLFGAGAGTAGGLLSGIASGSDLAMKVPGLLTAPGMAQLEAAQLAKSLPLSNLAGVEGLTLPIAGLGSTGSGSSTGTFSPSVMAMLTGGFSGGGGTPFGNMGSGLQSTFNWLKGLG